MHRQWTRALSTPDPWSFLVPKHSAVMEADGRIWSSPYPVVAMFWPGEFFQVFLLLKSSGTEYYCNVMAPVQYQWDAQVPVLEFVDLDLDVHVSGQTVRVLDEDEFSLRSRAYPEHWIAGAVRAKDALIQWGNERVGPFSTAIDEMWRCYIAKLDPEFPTSVTGAF